ncbi:MAG: preprotein translocase subunit SecE [Mycoplasmataceae bacterium]|jgi:preprotein translocase SecE subunit|nr:preprotein translocase subunit SecE [Mycoplasmataceae bacterium]
MAKKEKQVKAPKVKDPDKSFKNVTRRWYYGVGKEFNRITWGTKKKMLVNFIVIAAITLFLALVFLGIDYIFLSLLKPL